MRKTAYGLNFVCIEADPVQEVFDFSKTLHMGLGPARYNLLRMSQPAAMPTATQPVSHTQLSGAPCMIVG